MEFAAARGESGFAEPAAEPAPAKPRGARCFDFAIVKINSRRVGLSYIFIAQSKRGAGAGGCSAPCSFCPTLLGKAAAEVEGAGGHGLGPWQVTSSLSSTGLGVPPAGRPEVQETAGVVSVGSPSSASGQGPWSV